MGRVTVAILVGYVSTLLFVFVSLGVAYVALGAEGAFVPESFKPSSQWLWGFLAVGFVAGAFGAVIAGITAPGTKAPLLLADVVFVLGLLFGFVAMIAGRSELPPRAGDVSMMEALAQMRQPVWVALINPIVQKIGVYFGAFFLVRRGE